MKVRLFQRAMLVGAILGAGLLAATPAHALIDIIVQAEDGTVDDAYCGDGGDANLMGTETDGTRTVLFYPADGCSATYYTAVPASFKSITFKMTGHSGTLCGYFTVSGAITATTEQKCDGGANYVTANATSSTSGSGYYTITWHTGTGTATYANAYVDYHVITV